MFHGCSRCALSALSCLNPALVLQGPPRVGVTLALPSCVAYPLQMPGGVVLQPAPGKGNQGMSKLAGPWGWRKAVPGTVDETDVKVKWVEPVTLLFVLCSVCVGEVAALISWCVTIVTSVYLCLANKRILSLWDNLLCFQKAKGTVVLQRQIDFLFK